MRLRVIALLAFCCAMPAQTKKVIANLSPDMLKELAATVKPPARRRNMEYWR